MWCEGSSDLFLSSEYDNRDKNDDKQERDIKIRNLHAKYPLLLFFPFLPFLPLLLSLQFTFKNHSVQNKIRNK